jgi:hypothetical protein
MADMFYFRSAYSMEEHRVPGGTWWLAVPGAPKSLAPAGWETCSKGEHGPVLGYVNAVRGAIFQNELMHLLPGGNTMIQGFHVHGNDLRLRSGPVDMEDVVGAVMIRLPSDMRASPVFSTTI